jgi:hypothetical protein
LAARRNTFEVSDTTVAVGQTIQVSARRFRDSVQFSLAENASLVGTVSADPAGVARLTFVVPPTPLGMQRLDAKGTSAEGGTLELTTTLRVLEADDGVRAAGSRDPTGGTVGSIPVLRLTLVLAAGGILLAIGVIKRRQKDLD